MNYQLGGFGHMTSSSLSQASVFIIIRLAMVGTKTVNKRLELGGLHGSPGSAAEPWLLPLTSPFSLQTPHPVFPFSVRWLQCSAVEASGLR